MTLCSNDAKSCYDCILLLVVALCLCQLGAAKHTVFSMIVTLHKMEQWIKISFRNVTKLGSWKGVNPLQGLGREMALAPDMGCSQLTLT